ncbi:MAG: biopolymer transporter ExbD [Pseudomonadota bacterium]|nr:biopolymer transporter ExbD [Pseudomonadota bacterium]
MQQDMQSEEEITGINITPLVDVMLVLLVIFMVTSSYLDQAGITLELPTASTGVAVEQGITISIARDGKRYYKQQVMSDVKLIELLSDKQGEHITIAADQHTPHGQVVAVIDLVRDQKIFDISLHTLAD